MLNRPPCQPLQSYWSGFGPVHAETHANIIRSMCDLSDWARLCLVSLHVVAENHNKNVSSCSRTECVLVVLVWVFFGWNWTKVGLIPPLPSQVRLNLSFAASPQMFRSKRPVSSAFMSWADYVMDNKVNLQYCGYKPVTLTHDVNCAVCKLLRPIFPSQVILVCLVEPYTWPSKNTLYPAWCLTFSSQSVCDRLPVWP